MGRRERNGVNCVTGEEIYKNEFTYIGHMNVPTNRCRFYIHVTYMLKLHVRYTYVLNQPCGFAYMSHICDIYVDQ